MYNKSLLHAHVNAARKTNGLGGSIKKLAYANDRHVTLDIINKIRLMILATVKNNISVRE